MKSDKHLIDTYKINGALHDRITLQDAEITRLRAKRSKAETEREIASLRSLLKMAHQTLESVSDSICWNHDENVFEADRKDSVRIVENAMDKIKEALK